MCASSTVSPTIRKINNRLDTAQYVDFLSSVFTPQSTGQWTKEVRYVHDGFPVHSARAVNRWFNQHPCVRVVPWPPNFADVMPIETAWADLLQDLSSMNARNPEELWDNLKIAFGELDAEYFNNVIATIPAKLTRVIELDGRWIG